jgi:hypothetical protein
MQKSGLDDSAPSPLTQSTEAVPRALERHYTVAEVAAAWGLSESKVRELFRDEPGVLQTQLRTLRPRKKRQNISVRIPETILLRVHARLSIKG